MSPTRTTGIAISALWIFILISSGILERYVLLGAFAGVYLYFGVILYFFGRVFFDRYLRLFVP